VSSIAQKLAIYAQDFCELAKVSLRWEGEDGETSAVPGEGDGVMPPGANELRIEGQYGDP
jgi:hypothetical protein